MLFLHNLGYTIGTVLILWLGLFVYLKQRGQIVNRLFFFNSLAVAVFTLTHVIGVNTVDSNLSRLILFGNLSNLFIVAFNIHWLYAFLGIYEKRKKEINLTYVFAGILLIIYIILPDSFLLRSHSALYFPNYYNPGSLYVWMRVFFVVVSALMLYRLLSIYKAADTTLRNRLRYIIVGFIVAYGFGTMAVPLVYGIALDPVWSIFFPFYTIPFTYAIISYDLMDIRVVAKNAILYTFMVALVGTFVSFIGFSNAFITERIPWYPRWMVPLLSGIAAVGVGALIWRRLRELDHLKYEFMTVVMHKFRTPITHLKWSTESLQTAETEEAKSDAVREINSAGNRLAELTEVLISLARTEGNAYTYHFRTFDVVELVRKTISQTIHKTKEKKLQIHTNFPDEPIYIKADRNRFLYALQIIFENSVTYTPSGGLIDISIFLKNESVNISFKDNGIGIARADLGRIFSNFYRTNRARAVDTEGMGVSLFMARQIIKRHRGVIDVISGGEGKGSMFKITVPSVDGDRDRELSDVEKRVEHQ